MRATLINHRYYPFHGGSELYVQKLAEWLVACGWNARVVTTNAFDLEYFWDAGMAAVAAPPLEVIAGVRIERLPVRHPPGASLLFQGVRRTMGEASRVVTWAAPFSLTATALPRVAGLRETLDAQPTPDLIVATNLGLESLALAGLAAARRRSIPFVLFPFAHLGAGDDSLARRYVSMPHQRRLVRDADLCVALTGAEAEFLEGIGVSPQRLVVAGAGVEPPDDPEGPCRSALRPEGESFTVLSVGAMAQDKGTNDLVNASRRLARNGLEHRLVLVGPVLSSFADWFEKSGAGACPWIECRGVVEEDEKHALFREADVFVLASRTESFGIVYLEAWTHRLPVIGARVGAVREVISDGVDGLLVSFGDERGLARAIERMASDASLAASLGKAGYEKICRQFTWERVLERIAAAMQTTLGIEV